MITQANQVRWALSGNWINSAKYPLSTCCNISTSNTLENQFLLCPCAALFQGILLLKKKPLSFLPVIIDYPSLSMCFCSSPLWSCSFREGSRSWAGSGTDGVNNMMATSFDMCWFNDLFHSWRTVAWITWLRWVQIVIFSMLLLASVTANRSNPIKFFSGGTDKYLSTCHLFLYIIWTRFIKQNQIVFLGLGCV